MLYYLFYRGAYFLRYNSARFIGESREFFCFFGIFYASFKGRERNVVKPSTFYIEEAGYVEQENERHKGHRKKHTGCSFERIYFVVVHVYIFRDLSGCDLSVPDNRG